VILSGMSDALYLRGFMPRLYHGSANAVNADPPEVGGRTNKARARALKREIAEPVNKKSWGSR